MGYLFVGGIADGQRINVAKHPLYYRVPVPKEPILCDLADIGESSIEVQTYKAQRYYTDRTNIFTVYVLDSIKDEAAWPLIKLHLEAEKRAEHWLRCFEGQEAA